MTETEFYRCKICGTASTSPLMKYECPECGYTPDDVDYKEAYHCLKLEAKKEIDGYKQWALGNTGYLDKLLASCIALGLTVVTEFLIIVMMLVLR